MYIANKTLMPHNFGLQNLNKILRALKAGLNKSFDITCFHKSKI